MILISNRQRDDIVGVLEFFLTQTAGNVCGQNKQRQARQLIRALRNRPALSLDSTTNKFSENGRKTEQD